MIYFECTTVAESGNGGPLNLELTTPFDCGTLTDLPNSVRNSYVIDRCVASMLIWLCIVYRLGVFVSTTVSDFFPFLLNEIYHPNNCNWLSGKIHVFKQKGSTEGHSKGPRFYLCTKVPCLAVKKWNRSILIESNGFFL